MRQFEDKNKTKPNILHTTTQAFINTYISRPSIIRLSEFINLTFSSPRTIYFLCGERVGESFLHEDNFQIFVATFEKERSVCLTDKNSIISHDRQKENQKEIKK